MFMHGSWDHILGNMLFLAIFGKNVEDAFGHLRYLALYVAGGLAATLTQGLITLLAGTAADAQVPMLGASGAIAAVLGAYTCSIRARACYARVRLPGPHPGLVLPWRLVPLPARRGQLRPDRPGAGGGIAFFAHVGGFLFGASFAAALLSAGRVVRRAWRAAQ